MKPNPAGEAGEEYAARLLRKLGYTILARNFSCKYGELDIVAQKDGVIAFVEVKTRKSGSLVSGFEAVTKSKQRKIIVTALWYMNQNDIDLQPRFDVVCVNTVGGGIISHDYLEGAFDGGAYSKYH